jgi:transcriptional antiterminator NusG
MQKELIRSWYVLHTRSRFENVVNDGLLKKTLEVFLPKHQVQSKRRDRKAVIRIPLFPGYVFVKSSLEPNERIEILKTIGVVRMIGNKDGPVAVPSETVESLKIMVTANDAITTGRQFKQGDRVIVVEGSFAGVIGIFARYKGKGRVIVNLEALGQFAGVDVSEDSVEILPKI